MYPNLKDIESFISDIPDPEIPVINIKELGILRGIEFAKGYYQVTITPTYTACPGIDFIGEQIKYNLRQRGISNVNIRLTYSPAWNTDWITEDAKRKLKAYGIAPPKHSICRRVSNGNEIECPRCNSTVTEMISQFGSTVCKALYKCIECREPFEYFKCHG